LLYLLYLILDVELKGKVIDKAPCPYCGKMFDNLGAHLVKHEQKKPTTWHQLAINDEAYNKLSQTRTMLELLFKQRLPSYSDVIIVLSDFFIASYNFSGMLKKNVEEIVSNSKSNEAKKLINDWLKELKERFRITEPEV